MIVEAVAFDLDYTLAVPDRSRETLLSDALDRVEGPPISREAYREAHADDIATETREPIFESLLAGYDTEVSATDLTAAYRDAIEEALVPVSGAADLLRSLRESYRLGLLTDGPVRAQRGKLERLGWTEAFDAVVITGGLPAGKPDRRAFQALLDELAVPADRTVYVGDHPEFDVVGAAEAGLSPVQVLAAGDEPHPRAAAAVRRERLASDLPEAIRSLE